MAGVLISDFEKERKSNKSQVPTWMKGTNNSQEIERKNEKECLGRE